MTIKLLASNMIIFVTYEVLGVVLLRIQVTQDVTLHCWMSGYWYFSLAFSVCCQVSWLGTVVNSAALFPSYMAQCHTFNLKPTVY